MSRLWLVLVALALALAGAAGFAFHRAAVLDEAAQGAAWQSQDAATRFSTVGVPTDLDSQLTELDARRQLMAAAGTWREGALFMLVWMVVLGAASYVAHAIRVDVDSER